MGTRRPGFRISRVIGFQATEPSNPAIRETRFSRYSPFVARRAPLAGIQAAAPGSPVIRETCSARRPLLAAALAAWLSLAALPSQAQSITARFRQSTLNDVTERLTPLLGYQFRLVVGRETEELRRDFDWKDASLGRVLDEMGTAYGCEFYSIDATGFQVIGRSNRSEPETRAGEYRVRMASIAPASEDGQIRATLRCYAPDEAGAEAVVGLGPDFRAVDNFGRTLEAQDLEGVRSSSATRGRLLEFAQTVFLRLRDQRAVRLRSVQGSLLLYSRVTPVHFEFPLEAPGSEVRSVPAQSQAGVEARVSRWRRQGNVVYVEARLAWQPAVNLVGRGVSRAPVPYLVDRQGNVFRDYSPIPTRVRTLEGLRVAEQSLRFEGLSEDPARLVYDLMSRSEPGRTVPFQFSALALPETETTDSRSDHRALYDEKGGAVVFAVQEAAGKAVEGEVGISLAPRTADGWGGRRWMDVVTDSQGRVRLEHVRPGIYRVLRLFRFDPVAPPAPRGGGEIEVTVTAGRDTTLPALRLPIPAPAVKDGKDAGGTGAARRRGPSPALMARSLLRFPESERMTWYDRY